MRTETPIEVVAKVAAGIALVTALVLFVVPVLLVFVPYWWLTGKGRGRD